MDRVTSKFLFLNFPVSINLIALKFPGADALRKKNVQLLIRPVLGLRVAEECPYEEEEASPTPNKRGISTQIPLQWIHTVTFNNSNDDTGDVIGVSRETDGLLA